MSKRPDGVLVLAVAVARSGKSVWVKRVTEPHSRILAFDPKGEYATQMGFIACHSRSDLVNALKSHTGLGRIAYLQNNKKEFEFFCQCAFNWNRQASAVIICEELANVTNCGKASGSWGRLVSQGLAYGPLVIATVQRGQEVDKSVMNNASFLHVGRHNTDDDVDYIAKKLGLSPEKIPTKKLQFLQWNSDKGLLCEFGVDFMKSRKTKSWDRGAPRFRTFGKDRQVLAVGDRLGFSNIVY